MDAFFADLGRTVYSRWKKQNFSLIEFSKLAAKVLEEMPPSRHVDTTDLISDLLLNDEQPFDVILANINKNILKADVPQYAKKLETGGKLLLSGFFTTDVEELKAVADKQGLGFVAMQHENEWAMLVLQKR